MSEQNHSGSAATSSEGNQEQEKDQFVTRKAYEEVTRDMHKNKQKAKDLEAAFNELQAQLKAQEEQTLQEQERWKELYEKSKFELDDIRKQATQKEQAYLRTVKMSALKQELGVSIRDEYLTFAPIENIVITEGGSVDKDSLREAANLFRKEHGDLIPKSENVNITGQAPSNSPINTGVDLSKMNAQQLVNHYAKLKSEKQ